MIVMKRKLMALGLILSMWSGSASVGNINALRIHYLSGEEMTILLDEDPVVRFEDLDLVISTCTNGINIASDEVVKFTYLNVDPGGIPNVDMSDILFSLGKESVTVSNLDPHVSVSIYTVDGILMSSAEAASDGRAILPLPGQSYTVYLLKTPFVTFKIRRP